MTLLEICEPIKACLKQSAMLFMLSDTIFFVRDADRAFFIINLFRLVSG